jgi:Na+/H+-dicarboxylate symporter
MDYLQIYSEYLNKLIKDRLWAKVLIGMLLGVLFGLLLNFFKDDLPPEFVKVFTGWLSFPGKLFLKLIQMVMIALIVSSIISGIVDSSPDQLKTVGLKALFYFVFTTIVGVSIGTLVTYLIKPGKYMPKESLGGANSSNPDFVPTDFKFSQLPDMILQLIPSNPIEAMITGDMLSLVLFSIIVGISMLHLERKSIHAVIDLLASTQKIAMSIVNWAMKLVVFAVFGIMASMIANVGKDSIEGIGLYVITVILGLLLMFLFYLLLTLVVARKNPISFLIDIKDSLLLAFATTSSASVMPVSLKIAEEKLHVPKHISGIIIPLGTTINMDGTAIYQCISFIFIMQVYGIDPPLASVVLSMFTIVMASIGTPAVPGAGIIVLASVLKTASLPVEGIMMIIGFERILGMFRAIINAMGDLTACVVFDRFLKKDS